MEVSPRPRPAQPACLPSVPEQQAAESRLRNWPPLRPLCGPGPTAGQACKETQTERQPSLLLRALELPQCWFQGLNSGCKTRAGTATFPQAHLLKCYCDGWNTSSETQAAVNCRRSP